MSDPGWMNPWWGQDPVETTEHLELDGERDMRKENEDAFIGAMESIKRMTVPKREYWECLSDWLEAEQNKIDIERTGDIAERELEHLIALGAYHLVEEIANRAIALVANRRKAATAAKQEDAA